MSISRLCRFGMAATTGTSDSVTVPPNGSAFVEFGDALGSISGVVWADIDGDGIFDAGEAPLIGVTVTLVMPGADGITGTGDDIRQTVVTTGPYLFTGVPVGQAGTVSVDTSTLPVELRTATYDRDGNLDSRTIVTVTTRWWHRLQR